MINLTHIYDQHMQRWPQYSNHTNSLNTVIPQPSLIPTVVTRLSFSDSVTQCSPQQDFFNKIPPND
jgi:hypothetical protein